VHDAVGVEPQQRQAREMTPALQECAAGCFITLLMLPASRWADIWGSAASALAPVHVMMLAVAFVIQIVDAVILGMRTETPSALASLLSAIICADSDVYVVTPNAVAAPDARRGTHHSLAVYEPNWVRIRKQHRPQGQCRCLATQTTVFARDAQPELTIYQQKQERRHRLIWRFHWPGIHHRYRWWYGGVAVSARGSASCRRGCRWARTQLDFREPKRKTALTVHYQRTVSQAKQFKW